jgi:hypothetical protein
MYKYGWRKGVYDQLFFTVLRWVQINFIFPENVGILCLYMYAKKKVNTHKKSKTLGILLNLLLGVNSMNCVLTVYYASHNKACNTVIIAFTSLYKGVHKNLCFMLLLDI